VIEHGKEDLWKCNWAVLICGASALSNTAQATVVEDEIIRMKLLFQRVLLHAAAAGCARADAGCSPRAGGPRLADWARGARYRMFCFLRCICLPEQCPLLAACQRGEKVYQCLRCTVACLCHCMCAASSFSRTTDIAWYVFHILGTQQFGCRQPAN
jgi:hypothetical protein